MLGWNGPHGPCPRGYDRKAKSSGRRGRKYNNRSNREGQEGRGRRARVSEERESVLPQVATVTAPSFGENWKGGGFVGPLPLPWSRSTSAAAGSPEASLLG